MIVFVSYDILMLIILLVIALIGGSTAAYNFFIFMLIITAILAVIVGVVSIIKTIFESNSPIGAIFICLYKLIIWGAIVYGTIIFRQEIITEHEVGALEYIFKLITGLIEYGAFAITGAFAQAVFDEDIDCTTGSTICLVIFVFLAARNLF